MMQKSGTRRNLALITVILLVFAVMISNSTNSRRSVSAVSYLSTPTLIILISPPSLVTPIAPTALLTAVPPLDAAVTTVNTVAEDIWTMSAATPPPTNAPPAVPALPPNLGAINGIEINSIVVMPANVARNVRAIYEYGQTLGRNPRSFSKLGDSTIENPHFLTRFDDGPYNLGDYAYLQPVIDYFHGSFARQGVAVQRGLHTWSVLDPMWADPGDCQPGEDMLACEFRLHNPSVLIIKLGSNDAGVPDSTDRHLREIIEYCINSGVIPILSTKADRHEGGDINNGIIRQIAADYQIPLWDFDLVAGTLPRRGLGNDGVHLTSFFAHDWSSPVAFQRGYGIMDITALIVLDRVWRVTQAGS